MKILLNFVFILALLNNCYGYMADYIPLTKQEMKKKFKLKKDLELDGRFYEKITGKPYSLKIGANTIKIDAAGKYEPGFTFSGTGKNRKWRIITNDFGMGSYLYHGDLDKNGQEDIAIIAWTGGCGMSPNIHILTFMFDQEGLPVPFACDGYSDADENGIDDICDMDEDGKAVLIHMTYGDGYWVTSLYKAADAHWSRINGLKFGKEFPCYTRYSFKGSQVPTKLKKGKYLYAPDFSNDKPLFSGMISFFKMADIDQSEPVGLKISDDKGVMRDCPPRSWYSTCNIVLDTNEERKIVNYWAGHAAVEDACNEIYKGKYGVDIYGGRSEHACEPELIWAKKEDVKNMSDKNE